MRRVHPPQLAGHGPMKILTLCQKTSEHGELSITHGFGCQMEPTSEPCSRLGASCLLGLAGVKLPSRCGFAVNSSRRHG